MRIQRHCLVCIFSIIFLCLTFFSAPLAAAPEPNLYQAQVPVASNEAKVRMQAFGEALKQVLIKSSGKLDIVTLPALRGPMSSAAANVQSYSYVTRDDASGHKNLYLVVQFAARDVDAMLQTAGLKVWNVNRPALLVLLVAPPTVIAKDGVKDVPGKSLVGKIFDAASSIVVPNNALTILASNGSDSLAVILQDQVDRVGLSSVLPVMDKQDVSAMPINAVCGFNDNVLHEAAKRYAADVILTGCLNSEADHSWRGQWQLLNKGASNNWNLSAATKEGVVAQALDNVFKVLAGNFLASAQTVGADNVFILHVTQVNGLDQYEALLKYLRSVSSVKHVDLLELSGDKVELKIDNIGGATVFTSALAKDNHLVLDQAAADAAAAAQASTATSAAPVAPIAPAETVSKNVPRGAAGQKKLPPIITLDADKSINNATKSEVTKTTTVQTDVTPAFYYKWAGN